MRYPNYSGSKNNLGVLRPQKSLWAFSHTEVGESVQRAISNAKELFTEFYSVSKNYFYDSYTGLKKKRIAIAAGSSLSVVVLLVVFLSVVPNGALTKVVTDGITNVADTLLPDNIADGLKKILGKGEKGLFKYPEPQVGFTVPSDTGNSVIIPQNQSRDETYGIWVWRGRNEPPALGDILSTEGESTKPETKAPAKDKGGIEVLPAPSKYSWNTLSELRGKANRTMESVQDTLLLRINKAIEKDEWYSYSIDVRTALVDIEVLGKEIRENMSQQTVDVWNRLEPVYIKFYSDVYACEDSSDLRNVAGSDNYTLAVELTAEFLTALQQERLAEQ